MSWTRFFHRRRWDEERARELEAYLEIETDENIARGMSSEEARYAAHRKLGNTTLIREEIYHMNSLGWLETLWQDLRFALRGLRRTPGFAAIAILVLALGIGASTAMFSVVSAVLLRPLPYKDPDRLLNLWETNLKSKTSQMADSYGDFLDWRAQNHVFEGIAVHNDAAFTLVGPNGPVRVEGPFVSTNLFNVLGVKPALGRGFLPNEDEPGHSVVIISHDLWQRSFSSDPRALGQSIQLDHSTYTIVGVMPAGFQFPIQPTPIEVWVALGGLPDLPTGRVSHFLEAVARLRPSVTLEQARAEMATIAARLASQYPDTNSNVGVKLVPAHEQLVGKVQPVVLMLFGAVILVLLIACGNVANLLLARGTNREREIAIRAAIGAGRPRIVRQLLTESFLLAASGGALGTFLAMGAARLLIIFGPPDIPRLSQVTVDGRVLAFSLVITFFTGLVFGLAPALRTAQADLIQSLKTSGAVAQGESSRYQLRSALIVSEVALTLLLLAGAGLMLNSLFRLTRIHTGFNPNGVLTFAVRLSDADYSKEQIATRFDELLESLRRTPGVRTVAADTSLPLTQTNVMSVRFEIEGQSGPESPEAALSIVTPDFFRTLEIPMLSGRDFSVHDNLKSPPVVIVSQSLAQRYFPGEEALGKRIDINREIVGVVGDVRRDSLTARPMPALYMPESQQPFHGMHFVMRSAVPLPVSIDAVRAAVRSVDRNLAVYDIKTLDQYLGLAVAPARFNTIVLSLFAAVAMVLSSLGLYGVISYVVSRRTHEFGLRMALGATRDDVIRGVLREGLTLALTGIGIGLAGALALTRYLTSQLYEVKPTDPLTFIAVSAAFAAIALVATFIPARRATKVDPMVALRYE